MTKKKKVRITAKTKAGEKHQVVTAVGGETIYRRTPCAECPWKRESPVGAFPAEAYRISAHTAYDMGQATFACHMKGIAKPAICAGFLLRAHHNMSVRLAASSGRIDLRQVSEDGHELYDNYREMAVANGVDDEDPVIAPCR